MKTKEPDRFHIRKKDREIYDRLLDKGSPLGRDKGLGNKDVFLLAMCTGFIEGNRRSLDSKEGYFLTKYLSEEDRLMIDALAVAEENDLRVLLDKAKVFSIAEEYASGGIHILQDKVFSGFGSFSKRFEAELVRLQRKKKELI